MCIVFLAIDQHPDYRLIIAANRDEYHARPSAGMGFWKDHPQVLAGSDLQEGGTWLGLTRSGYFCTVTNYPEPSALTQKLNSRGQLVRQLLVDEPPVTESHQYLKNEGQTYRPFNLVFGNHANLHAYSNREQEFARLEKGFHSVSNGPMNKAWPKVSHGVKKLTDLIVHGGKIDSRILTEFMQDRSLPSDNPPKPGTAPCFSPIFIRGDLYGTRATTCLLFNGNNVHITESSYEPSGKITGQQEFSIEVSPCRTT